MKFRFVLFFTLSLSVLHSQNYTPPKVGDKAPDFILTVDNNAIQSFLMPYMKRIVLLHFWSSESELSKIYNRNLNKLYKRYNNTTFTNAEGFEIIAIAVQSDMETWKAIIKTDSLTNFTNGLAPKRLDDEVCMKYNIQNLLPTDILIDETGKIIAIDPKLVEVENLLDERRNFHPSRHDVVGVLAQSSNKNEVLKYGRIYLFNNYGDSIAKTQTNGNGQFSIHDIKLNQVFLLKVDNQSDIITSDPLTLYSTNGEFIMEGMTKDGGFVFNIPPRLSNKLSVIDTAKFKNDELGQIDVVKTFSFADDGKQLTQKDQEEIFTIYQTLHKNSSLKLQFMTHTDQLVDAITAMEITVNQTNAIRSYFERKGINAARINGTPKGNTEPRKHCEGVSDCSESDHRLNRRVEFVMYKD